LKKQVSKIISSILLTLAAITVVLVFWPPAGVSGASDPEAARSFDRKLEQLEEAHQRGEPAQARFTKVEVNSKLQQIFKGAPSGGLSGVRGFTVSLDGDELVSVLSLKVLELPLYITLGGKPAVSDHELQFDLNEVRLGHMPTSSSLISKVLEEKLNTPEGRDMMRMPDFFTAMRVENGELVIESH
jgi:hypothetical protein